MNKIRFFLTILLAVALSSPVLQAGYTQEQRQALLEAVNQAVTDLVASSRVTRDEPISILPLAGDQDRFIEGQLKNAITRAGLTYVEGRNDPVLDEILKEIAWDERKEDILDATTLDKFGRLKSTRLLLYGGVREVSQNNQQAYAEIELHLTSIETKQHLWGDLVVRRLYLPETVIGVIDLDANLRQILQNAFRKNVVEVPIASAMTGTRSIVVGPIAGDIDGYVASLAETMLTSGNLTVSRANSPTISEIRKGLRDSQSGNYAVLTGAVRDLSVRLAETRPLSRIYEVTAEVQLRIEDGLTGNTLWSRNILANERYSESVGVWDFLKEHHRVVWIVLGALVVLFLLRSFLRSMTRAR